jgi:putative Mg2+ transporter-C (MgtC) family protein
MLTDQEVALRLCVALTFGALIGLEREMHKKTAGLRTHMLVSLSTCLLMVLSIDGAERFSQASDPTRIAAGVITGIGFLGAGSIIRHGASVQGLTTAACIWTAAAVGLTTGAGMYLPAAMVVVLTLFTLYVVERVDVAINIKKHRSNLLVTARSTPGFINRMDGVFQEMGIEVGQFQVEVADHRAGSMVLDIQLKETKGQDRSEIAERILALPGVTSVEFY